MICSSKGSSIAAWLLLAITVQVGAQSPDLLPALDTLVVTANPLGRSIDELAQPVVVLDEADLIERMAPGLGEVVGREPGVNSTGFAPGATRPIIRGLGDDRLRILQNGVSLIDVSNVSPDHAVAADPLSMESVEIVRGPATLLYGPNTVGGVVNVLDGRIAEQALDGPVEGRFLTTYDSTTDGESYSGRVAFGGGPLVFHLDGFHRDADNLEIPGFARTNPEPGDVRGEVPNSGSETTGGGGGVSYVFDRGFIGFSYSGFDSDYGTLKVEDGEDVTIGLRQRRWDVRGEFRDPTPWLQEIDFKFGYSDYEHTEFEGEEIGTVFDIEGFNGRVELKHQPVGGFEGVVGAEVQDSDFASAGEEAYLPAVESTGFALFAFEEYELGKQTLQFGGRYDRQEVDAATGAGRTFDAFSTSLGVVRDLTPGYSASFTVGYNERPPTFVELYADGAHLATSTFEIGDPNLDTENSVSFDFSLRKTTGWLTGAVSAFYYRFDRFTALSPGDTTGLPADVIDEINDEDLDYVIYEQVAADFYGGEIEAVLHVGHFLGYGPGEDGAAPERALDVRFWGDVVRATNRNTDRPLPRIPPYRLGIDVEGRWAAWSGGLDLLYAAEQDRTAPGETGTDSFVLLGATLSYAFEIANVRTTAFLRGVNLTDEEARLHTSFLKDRAPLAGRGVILGLNTEF